MSEPFSNIGQTGNDAEALRDGIRTGLHDFDEEARRKQDSKVRQTRDWMKQDGVMPVIEDQEEVPCQPQEPAWEPGLSDSPPPGDRKTTADGATRLNWPVLAPEALYGLAGEVVQTILPHTEADPSALLVQFLTSFGNLIGRRAHFVADGATHHTNLFCVLVGVTSKGRKGTSWNQSERLLRAVDDTWASNRIMGGLSTGEGLIWAVRDPIYKKEPVRENKRIIGYQDVMTDGGETDKRLLILESEFALTLRVMARETSILSAALRQAWDTGNLRILNKNSPVTATWAHISIIGHITKSELLNLLTATDQSNGFCNRFLWLCVQRSKCLPEGGNIESVNFTPLLKHLTNSVEFARRVDEMQRDPVAKAQWEAVYPALSEGKPGVLGAVTSRAEAQVMRLV